MKMATIYLGTALFFLFVFSYICCWLFKIQNDKFYRPFHFSGGFLTFIFLNSLFPNKILCLILVMTIGVVWEIYEWLLWKLVLKKRQFQPKKDDTLDDFLMDFLGGLSALIISFYPFYFGRP